MLPNLSDIPRLRRNLGLTQIQLAGLSKVSQSAIAKIEHGQMIPSYELAKKLFDALHRQLEIVEEEAMARDVKTKNVRSVTPDTTLQVAADIMRVDNFSQLPVFVDGRNVGCLNEGTITKLIMEGQNPRDLVSIRVSQVMDSPLPTVDDLAPVGLVANLLQRYPAILVVDKGEVSGIIAKSDLMKLLR